MKTKKFPVSALAVVVVVGFALACLWYNPFASSNGAVNLVMTSNSLSYSVSGANLATFSLDLPDSGLPFQITYLINGEVFTVVNGVNVDPFIIGIYANDASWGLVDGVNTLAFAVKDASGNVFDSNVVSFMVVA